MSDCDCPEAWRDHYHGELGTHAPTNPAATVSQGKAVRRRGTTLARLRRWFRTWPFDPFDTCH